MLWYCLKCRKITESKNPKVYKKWMNNTFIKMCSDFNGEEVFGTFHEKWSEKANEKEFRVEKVLKRKGGKLYVKWEGYNNFFKIWNDKKESINE